MNNNMSKKITILNFFKASDDLVRQIFLEEQYRNVDRSDEDVAYIDFKPEELKKALDQISDLKYVDQVAYVSRIGIILESLKEDGLDYIPRILDFVIDEGSELVQACLSQIIPVSEYMTENFEEKGYEVLKDKICPFLKKLVFHKDPDVRALSRLRLGDIAPLLTEDDRNYSVLPVCLNLVHDENQNQNKVEGLKLLGQLTPLFTKEFIEGYITSELIALSQDPSKHVRSETIIQMAKIGSHIEEAVVLNKFLPEFRRLSKDKEWEVRKAFVDNAVSLAGFLPIEFRGRDFCFLFTNLLNDKSRWVKEATLKQLGYLLALLNASNMNEKLFEKYLNLPKAISKFSGSSKISIGLSCAETLPKVIKAYGKASWPSLRTLYRKLLKQDDKVKAELAKNLHLLAKNVSKRVAQTELLTVMNSFITSKSYIVKQEAIKNLAVYLETIDKNKRESMADVYAGLQADTKKWRIRDIIAGQIDILSKLFSDDTFNMIILPLIFSLCKDNVAKVREKACGKIFYLVKNKQKNEIAIFMIVEQIKSFADFNRFTWRQGFIFMCEGLMEMPEFFKKNFLDRFVKVCLDKVVNVRISAAKVLKRHIDAKSEILEDEEVKKVIERLRGDKSNDVRKIIFGKAYDPAVHVAKVFEEKVKEKELAQEGVVPNPFENEEIQENQVEEVREDENEMDLLGGENNEENTENVTEEEGETQEVETQETEQQEIETIETQEDEEDSPLNEVEEENTQEEQQTEEPLQEEPEAPSPIEEDNSETENLNETEEDEDQPEEPQTEENEPETTSPVEEEDNSETENLNDTEEDEELAPALI